MQRQFLKDIFFMHDRIWLYLDRDLEYAHESWEDFHDTVTQVQLV